GCAAFLVLLAAEERGLASYWRTPAVLRTPEGRAALNVADDVHLIGLLHLGPRRQEQPVPERAPLDDVVSWLDCRARRSRRCARRAPRASAGTRCAACRPRPSARSGPAGPRRR